MRKNSLWLAAIFYFTSALYAQTFVWTRISPDPHRSIAAYSGVATGPIYAWYAVIDIRDTQLQAKAVKTSSASGEKVSSFAQSQKAYVAVNGGFFGGSPVQSYSLVISDGVLAAKQIASVTRATGTYPIMRANFGVMQDRSLQTAWIYHWGDTVGGVYKYSTPLANTQTAPVLPPTMQSGTPWKNVINAIGGGPNLVSNGVVNITYDEEVMFGSGVGSTNGDPRTSIGSTSDGKIILFVVDGRGASIGMSLPQVASTMIALGCNNAINLDGGGSSTFYSGGAVYNTPSDGSERLVGSSFMIIPAPTFDKAFDASSTNPDYAERGTGWITTSNSGSYGANARLAPTGTGEASAVFKFNVSKEANCELSGWWVAANNRAKNTPFIVYSKGRVDTVRVDQTAGGSAWNKLGTFTFAGSGYDSVVISNAASGTTSPAYIVADGIRLVSYDTSIVNSVVEQPRVPLDFYLSQNYPNPFNPTTTITFRLSRMAYISLKMFDALGREVAVLAVGSYSEGEHRLTWNAEKLPSGTYFCTLMRTDQKMTRRLLLIK
jgi:hypothetical protein